MNEPNPTRLTELNLAEHAHALRPVRVDEKNNRFIHYTATTFPNGPRNGCWMWLNRCRAFGYLQTEQTDLIIDVLDDNADIIQQFNINRDGFEYLRGKLKFNVEKDDDK